MREENKNQEQKQNFSWQVIYEALQSALYATAEYKASQDLFKKLQQTQEYIHLQECKKELHKCFAWKSMPNREEELYTTQEFIRCEKAHAQLQETSLFKEFEQSQERVQTTQEYKALHDFEKEHFENQLHQSPNVVIMS